MPDHPTPNDAFPAIVRGFAYSPLAPALWREDRRTGLQCRSLGLDGASEGVLHACHLRAAGAAAETSALADPQSGFVFFFVLAGKVELQELGREAVRLQALDSACRFGIGAAVRWRLSHDAELVEISARAGFASAAAPGFPAASPAAWHINRDDEDSYTLGEGPRKYFRYRDLGVSAATGRRMHVHVVRSTCAVDGGTGWHSHSMGQLFYVLRGWADAAVERQPWLRMVAGDAMCVAPRMAHNVPGFTADYLVLEMCIPADYDTVDSAAPD